MTILRGFYLASIQRLGTQRTEGYREKATEEFHQKSKSSHGKPSFPQSGVNDLVFKSFDVLETIVAPG